MATYKTTTLDGVVAMSIALKSVSKQQTQDLVVVLAGELEKAKQESMLRTPVDTGHLKDSHQVLGPDVNGDLVSGTVIAGGPEAPYGVIVHEDLEMNHPGGGQAKFLQSVFDELSSHLAENLAVMLRPRVAALGTFNTTPRLRKKS